MSKRMGFKNLLTAAAMIGTAVGSMGPVSYAAADETSQTTSASKAAEKTSDSEKKKEEIEKVVPFGGQWVEIPGQKAKGTNHVRKLVGGLIERELYSEEGLTPKEMNNKKQETLVKFYKDDLFPDLQALLTALRASVKNESAKDCIGADAKGENVESNMNKFLSFFNSKKKYNPYKDNEFKIFKDDDAVAAVKSILPKLLLDVKVCTYKLEREKYPDAEFGLNTESGVKFNHEEHMKVLTHMDSLLRGLPNAVELGLRKLIYDAYITSSFNTSLFARYAEMDVVPNEVIESSYHPAFESMKKHWERRIRSLDKVVNERMAAGNNQRKDTKPKGNKPGPRNSKPR